MKNLILILCLFSTSLMAEKLAYIHKDRVIDILEKDDPRIKTVKKFQGTLVPIGDEFKEGDWILNGQKLPEQPSRNHVLDESGNWYLPQEVLEEEIKENAKKAKMIEIKEMMKKSSLTNAEMRKIIRLLLEHSGHLEAE